MSLVSASEGGQGNRRSAYQAEGKPLSKEALYRAQLKYGVYKTPANGAGTGLADSKSAPGEAANKANSNKKSIEAYKRMFVHADASKAATRAQKDVPRSFSLGENDGGAAEVLEQGGNPLLGNMDITKVLSGAEKAAEKRIGERLNPEKVNYVYGLRTGEELKHEGKAYTLTGDRIGRINAKSDGSEDKDIDPNNYAGQASAAALLPKTRWKGVDRSEIEYQVMSADYVKNMNSQHVLALARARADEKLKRIDKENKEKNIFSNEEYNKAAVEIAKKHFEERDRLYGGKVNLGGGLWLKAEEVDQIAQGIVAPVLSDVDKRVYQQRLVDEEIQQRTLTHEQEYAEWKSLQDQKLTNDELLLKEAAERHEIEEADASSTLKKKYSELVEENEELISAKEAELQRAREALEELQQENQKSVADSNAKVERELADLETVHKADLEDLRKEYDGETQPLLQDLQAKERVQQQLAQTRDVSKAALSDVIHRLGVEKSKKEELEGDLAHTNEKLAEQEDGLYALETKEQDLKGAIEELEVAAKEAEEEAKLAIAEVKEREVEFENSMDRRKSELKHIESNLDDEYRQLEGSNSYIAELKEGVNRTREQVEREEAAAREAAAREQARQTALAKEPAEVLSVKQPSEYHVETGKATRATRAAEPHVFVQGTIYPEPPTRVALPARHSTGSINPRKQQPQVVNRKQPRKGAKTGIPHKRDSSFGKFLHKIIPAKKDPIPGGSKKSVPAQSRAPPTQNQGFRRVRPSQGRPTRLNESQPARGPSYRDHGRASSGPIDEEDADILERSKVGKKKGGSLFTEIF